MIGSRQRRGFTLIELLVVIAIIAILAAILFPVFANAKKAAKTTNCLNNLKQIGTALAMYVDNNDNYLPWYWNGNLNVTWADAVRKYSKNSSLWKCPALKQTGDNVGAGYAYNYYYVSHVKFSIIGCPSKTVVICDAGGDINGKDTGTSECAVVPPSQRSPYPDAWPAARHNGKINALWCDSHVSSERYGSGFYPSVKKFPTNVVNVSDPRYKDQLWDTH